MFFFFFSDGVQEINDRVQEATVKEKKQQKKSKINKKLQVYFILIFFLAFHIPCLLHAKIGFCIPLFSTCTLTFMSHFTQKKER